MLAYLCDCRVAATRGSGQGVRGRVWASAPCAQAKSLQVSSGQSFWQHRDSDTGTATDTVLLQFGPMLVAALNHTVSRAVAAQDVPLARCHLQDASLNTVMGVPLMGECDCTLSNL